MLRDPPAELLVMPHARTPSWPVFADTEALRAVPVAELFTAKYRSDAHTAAYAATEHRKRLSGGAIERGVHPRMLLVVVDVDHPETHALNSDRASKGLPPVAAPQAWRAEQRPRIERLRADASGVVAYHTRGGYRLVGRIEQPHVIDGPAAVLAWKQRYALTLARLSRLYGILGDPACDDWTRLYRLPHATRKGSRSPESWPVIGDLSAVGVWPAPSDDERAADVAELTRLAAGDSRQWRTRLARVTLQTPKTVRRGRTRQVTEGACPDLGVITAATRTIGEALAGLARGTGERHDARLAVAGALLGRGWHVSAVERLVRGAAVIAGTDAAEWVAGVAGTEARRLRGEPLLGDGYLRDRAADAHARAEQLGETADDAPAVKLWLAVRGASQGSVAEQWRRVLDRTPPPSLEHTPADAALRLHAMLAHTRESKGVLVIDATTGTGKSRATCEQAAVAATRGHRTVILAPSHTVARECLAVLRARGTAVVHLAGVLAHETDDGAPSCRHHASAQGLAATGVDVRSVLCDGEWYGDRRHTRADGKRMLPIVEQAAPKTPHAPCEYRERCEAYQANAQQAAELEQALVVVTVHQMAAVAHEWLQGSEQGLAIIDEAPELLEADRYTRDEILAARDAIAARKSAVVSSETWRAELLDALAAGVESGAMCATLTELLGVGLARAELAPTDDETRRRVIATWAERCARRDSPMGVATGKQRDRWAPRPARRVVKALRGWRREQAAMSAVKLCGRVARALASEHGLAPRVVVAVGVREYGDRAGERELRLTAVVDHLAAIMTDDSIGRVVLDATANVPMLEAATGRARIDHERLAVRDGGAITRTFIPWSHGTRRHCLGDDGPVWAEIVGPLREGLTAAAEGLTAGDRLAVFTWRPVAAALERMAAGTEAPPEGLAELLDELRRRGVVLLTGYYGATRGRNDWNGARGLLAFGTPWPEAAAIEQQAAAVGVAGGGRDLARHLARAELEQAIGRFRAPWAVRGGRVVVVASETPLRASARWGTRELVCGRVGLDAAAVAELAGVLSRRETAALLGVSRRAIGRVLPSEGGHDGVGRIPLQRDSLQRESPTPTVSTVATFPESPAPHSGDRPVTGNEPIAHAVNTVYSLAHGATQAGGDGEQGPGGGIPAGEHRRAAPRSCGATCGHRAVGGS